MYKSKVIADFIRDHNPKRKEMIRFIVVEVNKKKTAKEFDKNPRQERGYYSKNFQTWVYNKKVYRNSKTGRYSLTDIYNRDGMLYQTPPEVLLEVSERAKNNWKENYWDMVKQRNEVLIELKKTERELKEVKGQLSVIENILD